MLSTGLAALLLAALAPSTLAQTFSTCKDNLPSCPVNKAQKSANVNFNTGNLPTGWIKSQCNGGVTYSPDGVAMTVATSGDCPGIETEGYVFFGLFEFKVKAAPGQGIVSSMVMESDALDEVDWEFIGGENFRVQSNYFGKGNTTLYNRMVYIPVTNNQQEWHTYSVNWTSAAITWLVDNVAVRTLNYADAVGGTQFPQTPMKLKIGNWAGGDPSNNSPGTVTWAGGDVDYSKGPFTMSIASANIVNYSPGDSYTYGDNSGSWKSIKVNGGSTGGIVSPAQGAAAQSSLTSSKFAVSTGSGIPVAPPIATASANASATVLKSLAANSTSVASASLKPSGSAAGASNSAAASASPSKASSTKAGPATQTANAASANGALAGAVSGSALLALFMTLFI